MTAWPAIIATLLLAANPAAIALAAKSWRPGAVGAGFALAAALVGACALGGSSLLGWLDIEPESFRTAAGVVMAATGVRMLWEPAPWSAEGRALGGAVPLGWPWIANPAMLAAAISFGADAGETKVIVAGMGAVLLASVAALLPRKSAVVLGGLARLSGAGLVVMAAALVVSAVRDI